MNTTTVPTAPSIASDALADITDTHQTLAWLAGTDPALAWLGTKAWVISAIADMTDPTDDISTIAGVIRTLDAIEDILYLHTTRTDIPAPARTVLHATLMHHRDALRISQELLTQLLTQ